MLASNLPPEMAQEPLHREGQFSGLMTPLLGISAVLLLCLHLQGAWKWSSYNVLLLLMVTSKHLLLCNTEFIGHAEVKGLCLDFYCIFLFLRNQCKPFCYCPYKFPRTHTAFKWWLNVFKVLASALSARKIYEKGRHILSFLRQCRLNFIEREERYFYEEQVKVLAGRPTYNGTV